MGKPNATPARAGRAASSSRPSSPREPKAGAAVVDGADFVDTTVFGPGDVSEFAYETDTETSRPTQPHSCLPKGAPHASAAPPVAGAGDVSEFDYEAGDG